MIKFRQKLFYRAPKVRWNLSEYGENNIDVIINVEYSKKFAEGKKDMDPLGKSLIEKFKKDIKNGFIYDDVDDKDDTEYLDKISKTNKYLVYSKKINGPDRLNYMIYKPTLEISEIKEGSITVKKKTLIIKIVIYSCKGHTGPDGKPYFDLQ